MLWSLLFILVIVSETNSGAGAAAAAGAAVASPGGSSEDEADDQTQGTSCTKGSHQNCEALLNSQKPALNGTTSQSSNYENYYSGRALDGNMLTCAHTKKLKNSWWTIDLLGVYNISNITIYNTDADHTDISGAQILIGNSRKINSTANKICANITNFKKDDCNDFQCPQHTSGRYITVFRATHDFVIVCEVRINGKKKESPFKLIQESKTWEEALDYCRDKHTDLASILDEETQAFAELEARNATTPYVWLGLRYTCTLSFWFWVADYRLEFSYWGEKTEDCNRSAAMLKTEDHQWVSKPDHMTFNFICEK